MARKTQFFLGVIILLAIFLRFFQLDINPPGLHGDEADIGYTAYSILETGLSQYGSFNLLALQEASGGTRPPLYTYTLLPLVKLFGLSLFVERLPSAIFGVLSVIVLFLILKKLFKTSSVALTGAFLLTVNPWAIHMSRQGLLEAIALFFVMGGVLFFLYGDTKKKYWYTLSAFFFGLSIFAYDAPKIFLPFFLLLLLTYQKDTLLKIKKYTVLFLFIIGIFYLLMLKVIVFDGQISDYNSVSVFNLPAIEETVNWERHQTKAPLWLSSIFHNKVTVALDRFERSYFNIFSLNWFFVSGHGNLQQSVAKHGQFYLFELPFFFIGIYLVLKKNLKLGFLLLGWMLLGALPGGITSGNYPYRSVLLLPVPLIFSSVAIVWFWNYVKHVNFFFNTFAKVGMILVFTVFILNFLFIYFFDYPVYASEWWAKQQNDTLHYAISNQGKYDKIFVDGRWVDMYAFITKTDPKVFQKAYANQEEYKGVGVMRIGKFYFGTFLLPKDVQRPEDFFPKKSLVIADGTKFKHTKPLKEYKDPGGVRTIFNIFSIK